MSDLNIIFSAEDTSLSYGYFNCPACNSSFFGGGEPIHRSDCPKKLTGYEGLNYVIGVKVFTRVMSGEDRLNPVTVADLERCLPEMVKIYRRQLKEGLRDA